MYPLQAGACDETTHELTMANSLGAHSVPYSIPKNFRKLSKLRMSISVFS